MFKGVPIFNKKPRHLQFGGFVKTHPKMTRKQLENDSIYISRTKLSFPSNTVERLLTS